ncbi:MAG: hypothetical protein K1X35_12040 [Caulobacteraceae bacterium]|nr:hypothetical protein [Caulobacteraceae bacterium]
MRLKILLAATAATALSCGVAMAQTADRSNSTIPPTNDPTTRTDDECGANRGPRPCGGEVVSVPIPANSADYVAPATVEPAPMSDKSTSAMYSSAPATPEITTRLVTNGPVPDTPENRARFGGPDSNGGRHTTPAGN